MPLKDLLFSFDGRINRKPFLLAWIGIVVAQRALSFTVGRVLVLIVLMLLTDEAPFNPAATLIATSSIALIFLWPFAALGVKRLHDTDNSGWRLLLLLVPFVNFLILFNLIFVKGTDGPNQYGPDPLAPDSPAVDMPASPPEVEPGPPPPA